MVSSRRSAQLGLMAACLILVWSIGVLVVGAADDKHSAAAQSETPSANVSNQNSHANSVPLGMSQSFAVIDKR